MSNTVTPCGISSSPSQRAPTALRQLHYQYQSNAKSPPCQVTKRSWSDEKQSHASKQMGYRILPANQAVRVKEDTVLHWINCSSNLSALMQG